MASDRPDLTIYCREREFAYAIIVVLTITAVPRHCPWIWFLGGGYLVFAHLVKRLFRTRPFFIESLLKTLGKDKGPETVTYQTHHRMGSGGKEGGRR